MSIFSKIKDAIWGHSEATAENGEIDVSVKPVIASASTMPGQDTDTAAVVTQTVDVAAILEAAVKKKGQKLNWRTSIVDLMKALDLDSSLSNRKELARELGYDGDAEDSAKMNIWLHKQVMQKLQDNGGAIPPGLL